MLTEIDLCPHDAPPATRIFEVTGDPYQIGRTIPGPVLGGATRSPIAHSLGQTFVTERDVFASLYRAWHSSVRADNRARCPACQPDLPSEITAVGYRLAGCSARCNGTRIMSHAAVASACGPLSDLPGLFVWRRYHPSRPSGKALLYGPMTPGRDWGGVVPRTVGRLDDC